MPHPRRKRLSQAARSLVAFNQDYQCAICAEKLPVGWHLDHRVPLSHPSWAVSHPNVDAATDAANAIGNLQAVCGTCHARKSLLEQEPDLAPPVPSRPPHPKHIPWQAVRLRKRHQKDAIWAMASPRDPLRAILTSSEVWAELEQASTDRELRKVHRKVERAGRRIDFGQFKRTVEHLTSS